MIATGTKCKSIQESEPPVTDAELIFAFFDRMPLMERWQPISQELLWVLGGRKIPADHKNLLPAYCYEIFDIYRRTIFKNLPSPDDLICITNNGKTGKDAKQTVKMDWRGLGRMISIGERGMQFFDMEAIAMLKADGLLDFAPEKETKALRMIYGNSWLKQKIFKLLVRPHRFFKRFMDKLRSIYFRFKILGFSKLGRMAYQAGPKAMAEFKAGLAEGQVGFLDSNGQLVGESNRANNYQFLLLAWPEIKDMLEKKPLPTRTDVFNWTKPYTKAGIASFIDIDQFRDVCEDIKLKFAGRSPKKDPIPPA